MIPCAAAETAISYEAGIRGRLLHGSLVWNHVGSRYLNKRNTVQDPACETWDANFGYRSGHWDFTLAGFNLSGERPPASESELGESQYYRLPARSIEASATFFF